MKGETNIQSKVNTKWPPISQKNLCDVKQRNATKKFLVRHQNFLVWVARGHLVYEGEVMPQGGLLQMSFDYNQERLNEQEMWLSDE